MERWKQWFESNRTRMDGYLKSIRCRLPGFMKELPDLSVSMLDHIRSSCSDWLEKVLRAIYNSGGFLVPLGSIRACTDFDLLSG